MKVHEAIVKIREDVGAVRKDGRNTQQNFNFRGVDAVVNAVSAAMSKHGVMVFPSKVEHRDASKQLSGGKMATAPVVIVDYTFVGPEGDQFVAQVPAESFDLGDKATAKAMSVAYRTCLLQVFTLPTDDADPDEHTYERAPRQQPQQQQTIDWQKSLTDATGNPERLAALRAMAARAGAPPHYMAAVDKAIQEATPIEGALVDA